MKIAISSESTLDLSKELIKQYDIHVIPFTVLLGEDEFLDGEISSQDIFDFVAKKKILPRTSAINEFQYKEYFKGILDSGYDAVIHFSLSSQISTSCSQAELAASKMDNVYVVDSRSLSTGIALEVIYASKLAKKGLKPEEIVEKVKARIPYVQASFVIQTLEYLHKGGRCSGLARVSAALLHIKPQIIVSDGKMAPAKKYFGRKSQVIAAYCRDTLEQFANPDLSIAFVTHTLATPEMVANAIEALKNRGFKTIYETKAGATITSHCGPMTLGILFINDGLNEE
ncbi:MAG: DegV family protein [Bacilli bacterium]|nr:DegV family protein [Bacilli bacterium]